MSRPTRNTLFGCVLCLVLAGLYSCAARAADRPFQFLTLDCLFRDQISTELDHGKLKTSAPKDTLAITLSNFDYDKGTASLIGNAGAGQAMFVPSYKKIALVQFSETMNPVVTTVSEPIDGKAIAFQSRHIWMIGRPIISEFQGDCSVRK